jgi:flagellin
MGDVTLSKGVRVNLLQLQRSEALRNQVNEHLATGRRVNRVADDPRDFYAARAAANRVGDLFDIKSGINQALSSAAAAQAGLGAVEDLTHQLQGIATAARGGTAEQRQAAAEQFDRIRAQIDSLAADASYGGNSLIDDPADTQTTTVGDLSDAEIDLGGTPSSADALGIGSAAGDYGGFATDADVDAALNDLADAKARVRSTGGRFGSDIAALNTRETFTDNLSQTLQVAESKLAAANLNEEAARRMALELQDRFATAGLRFAVRTESLVTDLLGSGGGGR